jgi:ABC-type glutathione transport system ATPase component
MLDATTRIDVLNLLGDLEARGLGILFITRDLSLGNHLSDTAVILHRSELVETGPTGRVFGRPEPAPGPASAVTVATDYSAEQERRRPGGSRAARRAAAGPAGRRRRRRLRGRHAPPDHPGQPRPPT